MRASSKSYPHPVLGNENDVGGFFRVAPFHYELKRDEITLNPVFNLKNAEIERLIGRQKASFVTEVECRSAFFRTSFATNNATEKFSIPSKLVREGVLVGFYVCADENISGYRPSECHPDYGDARFDIEAGDVLAFGGYTSFIAEKSFDPLRPPVSSLMTIEEGSHHEGPMQIDYDTEKITIILSKNDWKNYNGARSQKDAEGMLHSSIVLPVLVDAIYQIENRGSEFTGRSWFERLGAILDAKGLRNKEPFEVAQRILDNPASRGFQSMASLLEVNDEPEYE